MTDKSSLRIIGGKWRSRKIFFTDMPGLRPTHDRIRETLFNWLQFDITDAVCLDLFAGSGALGFEALSRGAKEVTFVDISPVITKTLQENINCIGADNTAIYCFDFNKNANIPFNKEFDIVFLDPPFHQSLLAKSISWLTKNQLLNTKALIYIEVELGGFDATILPENWEVLKHKKTQSLEYLLCQLGSQ